MSLAADQFELLRRIVDEHAGMALEPDQQLFAERRLSAVAERHGWTQRRTLVDKLRELLNRILVQEVIESLATHEASFFRDPYYFEETVESSLWRLFAARSTERRLAI